MSKTTWWERILAAVLIAPMCVGMAVLMLICCLLLALAGPFAVLFMDDPFGRHKKAQPEVTA